LDDVEVVRGYSKEEGVQDKMAKIGMQESYLAECRLEAREAFDDPIAPLAEEAAS
jgi:hypothetical protein